MHNEDLPLKGVRVVDFSEYVAAPAVGKLLADWGAEVVKVEKIEGDVWRYYGTNYNLPCNPDENPLFDLEHLKKKFLALNIKTPEGREIMDRMLSRTDIFITNFRSDALARLRYSYEDLAPKYPRLIYGHLLGYGEKGPDSERAGFDVVSYWARSGAMLDLVPAEHSVPLTAPYGFGDHITGATLTGGICAALYRREKTGKGDRVYISLFGSAIFGVSCMITSTQEKYKDTFPRYLSRPTNPVGHTYQCKDGRWLIVSILAHERYWPVFCTKVIHRPEMAVDDRFCTKKAMVQNNRTLYDILKDTFLSKDSEDWAALLDEADIAYERVKHFSEVTKDPQAWANEFIFEHTFRSGNTGILPRTPVQFDSFKMANPPSGYGTRIGEHTREILIDLGYSESEMEMLEKRNAVKIPPA